MMRQKKAFAVAGELGHGGSSLVAVTAFVFFFVARDPEDVEALLSGCRWMC